MTALAMCFPATVMPSFGNAVFHVIRICPDEKMLWIEACRVVALVANFQIAIQVKTKPEVGGYPMDILELTIEIFYPISLRSMGTIPIPASSTIAERKPF
jgi:hypothetical protein